MHSTTKPSEAVRDLATTGGALLCVALLLYVFYPDSPLPQKGSAPALESLAVPPPPSLASAPEPPSLSTAGMRLSGLLGGGAIIALADGSQRWVAIGREVLPGLKVQRIEQHHLVLVSGAGEIRLGFGGVSASASPTASASASPAGSSEAARREETLRYRLGLEAGRDGKGYVVRRGVPMPALERAGIRPGDVILGVNGSRLNEEQMLELPWTIANSTRTEFELVRGGRRMRLALEEAGR